MFRELTSKRYDEARKWTENAENRADHSVARGEAVKLETPHSGKDQSESVKRGLSPGPLHWAIGFEYEFAA
jgi:hypothetical protein